MTKGDVRHTMQEPNKNTDGKGMLIINLNCSLFCWPNGDSCLGLESLPYQFPQLRIFTQLGSNNEPGRLQDIFRGCGIGNIANKSFSVQEGWHILVFHKVLHVGAKHPADHVSHITEALQCTSNEYEQ